MFAKLNLWKSTYAPGRPDNRSVGDFMDCETMETVRAFQAELTGIFNGNFDHQALQALLGKERLLQHGSWEEWARSMLRWMAAHKP